MSTVTTRDLVKKHAWAMVEQGVWPTQAAIRRKLGNTGSKSTIGDEFRRWTQTAVQLLFKAKQLSENPPPEKSIELEAKIITLNSLVDELRSQLTQAYDRFEGFENRMLIEVDKARNEHLPKVEKAQREAKILREESDRIERTYLGQIRVLSERLSAAGLDPDY